MAFLGRSLTGGFPGEKTAAIADMMHADRRRSAFCSGCEPRRSPS
ncbi:hypothetical protein [Phormidium sp. CCY1219]|nr:hypothetical protein [Phormidium sp. CCY1219]